MTDDRHAQELLAQDIAMQNMAERHSQELLAYQITADNLRTERDAVMKDAERYRWLRDMTPWTAVSAFDKTRVAFRLASKFSEEAPEAGVDLDAAIDAAIAKAESGAV